MERKMKSVCKKLVAVVLLMALCTSPVSATLYSVPKSSTTTSAASSVAYKSEYYKVTTPTNAPKTVYVEGKTNITTKLFCIRIKKDGSSKCAITTFVKPNSKGEFKIKINTKKGNKKVPTAIKGTVKSAKSCYDTRPGYRAVEYMAAGMYHLTIARATTTSAARIGKGSNWYNGPLGGKNGYAYKDFVLKIKSGSPNNLKVVKYTAAADNNKKVRNQYEEKSYHIDSYKGSQVRYKDKYLKDIAFVAKNPGSEKFVMTTTKLNYIKKVANDVTGSTTKDYTKALRIYNYVAKNFYYDVLANKKLYLENRQYADPYKNLYNLRNKKSAANAKSGKVATTCQGYSSMVIAMARAEGIPARLVYGHHISQPNELWSDVKASKIDDKNHWWAELYINGRWVFVDATAGSLNKWNRSSFSSSGTWVKKGRTGCGFDMAANVLSCSYSYNNIYEGANDGKYANRKTEVNQLRDFLNLTYNGKTNGKRLNSNYNSARTTTGIATWCRAGVKNTFETNGYGRVYRMKWHDRDLKGALNLSNFAKLKYLTIYNNELTKLTLTGCSDLTSLSVNYNDLTSLNTTASSKATSIAAKANPLTSAKFKHAGKTITIKAENGDFGFTYYKSNDKKVTIYAGDAPEGYKYKGIYKGTTKVSGASTYAFTPSETSTYTVKYAAN